jgi:ATP adenylyltransferase
VSLEQLWAGWRGEYVTSAATPDAATPAGSPGPTTGEAASDPGHDRRNCVFCRIADSGPPSPDNCVLWRGELTYAVLNAYPYANGHLMVLPIRHLGTLGELHRDESTELWAALERGVAAVEAALGAEGVNLGANLGRAAGAGIPRHLHLHAVPRWIGDTNFMTTVAGTRVLPEALFVTWEKLRAAWPGGESST